MEKYNFNTKLYEVCSDDPLRPIMNCVHFKNGFAYASNGYAAIRQSLEYHSILSPELLENKSVHRASFKQITSFEVATCNEDGVECKDADGRTAFFEYFDRKGVEIPNFETIFQRTDLVHLPFIGFNPEMFYKLSKAMHYQGSGLRVRFQGIDKAILVDAIGINNQDAIIMPIILNDSLF